MKKYLLLMYNKPWPAPRNAKAAKEGMKPWNDWFSALKKKGNLDSGMPVMRDGKSVSKTGVKNYKAKSNDLGGYMIIKAKSLDEAAKIAKTSPHAMSGMGVTVVREVTGM